MNDSDTPKKSNFIRQIIESDLASGKHVAIQTRFPPEPNGYLHIGHAKSICLNFGVAEDYDGRCNLRFDDTNPHKENAEFVRAIEEDVRWLGYDWEERMFFASDYFEPLYEFAVELIRRGRAYVCDLTAEQIRDYRGTLTEAGRDSPYRERSVEESLDLFARMRAGEFPDGSRVLRAKIDMASPNINLRDPTIYRIRHGVIHHQTGDEWSIYPMYDFTHCLSDMLEEVTHSLCTLEFEDHRPLYDWFLDALETPCHPRQIEFARLNLEYTVLSKRKLTELVDGGHVESWDDPRMPTIAGLRRRGYTPVSIRNFCERIGVTKADSRVEMQILEGCIREDLEQHANRRLAVLDPLKVVLTNYPEEREEEFEVPNHPQEPGMGERPVPFCRELWIERADFMEEAPRKFKRLVTGGEVRLRNAYVIRCDEVVKDDAGEIVELRCRYDPETLGRNPEDRKVKGVIHWVSARHGVSAEVRLYDRLFTVPNPEGEEDWLSAINPESLEAVTAVVEPALADAAPGERFQFERTGYFCADRRDHSAERPVFNRTVALRDSWAKIAGKG
jgi:glutaminyl-tRNA synthetase